jgi:hypothetical protein
VNFYLVRNAAGAPIWAAHQDDEMRIWVYLQNTGRFHLNQGLYRDFLFEHANSYEPITVEAVRRAICDGIGRLDASHQVVERFRSDPEARTAASVLNHTGAP